MNTKHPSARVARPRGFAVMRFLPLLSALSGAPLAVTAAPLDQAGAEPAVRYLSAHVGLNNLSDWPARVSFGGPEVEARLQLKRGANLGLAFGRQAGPGRHELEYQHGRFDIERASIGRVTEAVDASGSYDVLTANALRELYVHPAVTVYGGIGAGLARVKLPQISLSNGCRCLAEADRTGFAWQARVGAERRVTASGLVFGQLGYLSLPGPRAQGQSAIRYRSRATGVLSVGYRHQF
jgi:opacity protein-like surface antigen